MLIPRRFATAIITIVSIVWAANFGAQFVVPGYKLDGAIDGIFMATVGGALLVSYKQDGKHQRSERDNPPRRELDQERDHDQDRDRGRDRNRDDHDDRDHRGRRDDYDYEDDRYDRHGRDGRDDRYDDYEPPREQRRDPARGDDGARRPPRRTNRPRPRGGGDR